MFLVVKTVENDVMSTYVDKVGAVNQKDLVDVFVDTKEVTEMSKSRLFLTVETC